MQVYDAKNLIIILDFIFSAISTIFGMGKPQPYNVLHGFSSLGS